MLRPQLEAIVYAAETPISLDQILSLVKESVLAESPGIDVAEIKSRIRATLEELIMDYSGANHGIEIRQVAGGYRMSTKPEQHDVVRAFAKSLKPPFRTSGLYFFEFPFGASFRVETVCRRGSGWCVGRSPGSRSSGTVV